MIPREEARMSHARRAAPDLCGILVMRGDAPLEP
jgi:hypothetical protein